MKHFEISYCIGRHAFTFECTTVFEAITALSDIAEHDDNFFFDADKYIEILMRMRDGKTLSFANNILILRYVDGQV